MKNKKVNISYFYGINLLTLVFSTLSIIFMDADIVLWYPFLVLFVLSVFETIFFYRYSNNSFKPINAIKGIECILISIGATVVSIGSVIFILILFN